MVKMNNLIQITVSVLCLFSYLPFSRSSLFSIVDELTCKIKNSDVSLSTFDLNNLISFLDSQRDDLKEVKAVLSNVDKSFENRFMEASESDEDIHLNITELIKKYGFKAEEHDVTTDDGYVLTMHRIVGDGPVVFVMHGIFLSADDFVLCGQESLAFLIASEGYDVWLGNARGNKHSRKHVSLSPECEEFWEFSFHETGRYDLPAMIDYALDTSGNTNLTYIGFSQGTTNLLVMCSELPEYNKKISLAVLLAPIAFMTHLKSPILRVLSLDSNQIMKFGTLLGLSEIEPNKLMLASVTELFCENNPLSKFICGNLLNLLCGLDANLLNVKHLPAILAHQPGGGSVKQIVHYGQEILSGKFRQFDFKKSKNEKIYGSENPPEYCLNKISAPIAYFYGGNDWLANVTDVHKLRDNLPNVVKTKFIEKYNHGDLIWAKNFNKEIFSPLLKLIKKFQF